MAPEIGSATKAATAPVAGCLDRGLQLRGEGVGIREGVGSGSRRTVRVGRRDVAQPGPAKPRLVGPAEGRPARQVQRAEGVAVVAAVAGDDDVAVGLATGEVVGTGHLQGGLDRLRPAADRVDRGAVDRQHATDLGGIRLERLRRERAAMGVGERGGLLAHDAGDLRPAVTDVHDDRAAGGVEVLASVRVANDSAVGRDGDGRLRIERPPEDATGGGRDAHRAIVPIEQASLRSSRNPSRPSVV